MSGPIAATEAPRPALDQAARARSRRIGSPYVGLVPYTEDDARFFFGREREIRLVTANLFSSRLTIFYGASGVGKSSLLRAGVLRSLRQRIEDAREHGEPPDFAVAYFNTWQGDVLPAFRRAVGDALRHAMPASDDLVDRDLTLVQLFQAATSRLDGDLLVMLDQFEEYFLYHAAGGKLDDFAHQFAAATHRSDIPVSFLIGLRDDSVSKLDCFKALIPNLFSNYLRLPHLGVDEAAEAIRKPIEEWNRLPANAGDDPIELEPALVEQVIESVRTGRVMVGEGGKGRIGNGSRGVETPYLQLVMSRIWADEADHGSRVLRAETLTRLGGAQAIVMNHVDTVVNNLSPEDRDIGARIFNYLVTPSGTKIAYTLEDLADLAGVPPARLEPVLSELSGSRSRVLTPVAPPVDQPGLVRYEIYHDSLARAILDWRRRYFHEKDLAEEQEKRRVEAEEQRKELEQARTLADAQRQKADAERRRAEIEHRSAHRFRVLTIVMVVLALTSVLAAVFAFSQYRAAQESATAARDLELRARQAEDLAKARTADLEAAQAQLAGEHAKASTLSAQAEQLRQDASRRQAQLNQLKKSGASGPELEQLRKENAELRARLSKYERAQTKY